MIGNTFGTAYRITTFGESHGPAVGVVIDGLPANMKIDTSQVERFLARRRTNQSQLTSARDEPDKIEILSGVNPDFMTLGSPVTIIVRNVDQSPQDYSEQNEVFRPSHADYTYWQKYHINAASGGGRASARETVARVIAGALAYQVLKIKIPNFEILTCVSQVRNSVCPPEKLEKFSFEDVENSPVRCPDLVASHAMVKEITAARDSGDTVGGVIFCRIKNFPPGCGEPVFDKLEAEFSRAMLSLPAAKAFEIGSGFAGCAMLGSEQNDAFRVQENLISTVTNNSGGIQGGISNGEDIYFRTGFKPVSTHFKSQRTVTKKLQNIDFKLNSGRHDPCVLPRAVVMVEAMALSVLLEFFLRQKLNKE